MACNGFMNHFSSRSLASKNDKDLLPCRHDIGEFTQKRPLSRTSRARAAWHLHRIPMEAEKVPFHGLFFLKILKELIPCNELIFPDGWESTIFFSGRNRGDRIRTCDFMVPNHAL